LTFACPWGRIAIGVTSERCTAGSARRRERIANTLVDLLTEHPDLPGPDLVSISRRSREIDLQFPDSPDTFKAMAVWADRFGGTLTGEPRADKDGTCVRCEVRFDRHGVLFKAYAYVTTADRATT
jgi:hypothetical protein